MTAYKDMTFCNSFNCKNETCSLRFTDKDRELGIKWWGNEDFPLATATFRGTSYCPGYIGEKDDRQDMQEL